jgi:hypothetical protein
MRGMGVCAALPLEFRGECNWKMILRGPKSCEPEMLPFIPGCAEWGGEWVGVGVGGGGGGML